MKELKELSSDLKEIGVDAYLVGGCVRDSILGIQSDDIDVCLVRVKNKDQVLSIIKKHAIAITEEVGNSFPVWIAVLPKIGKVDFALARTERKSGISRKEFECQIDNVSIEEDLERRDLTINAIAINILTGEFVDPFNGVLDLNNRIAHPVGKAFSEDSLRVIRAARFCSIYNLTPSEELLTICRELTPEGVSNERVGMELMKLFKNSEKPSIFFQFLREVDWLKYHFQELEATIGIQQSPTYHPEGDVFNHLLLCIDQAKDWFTRTVMLCHDLGKVSTTVLNSKGEWSAPGHEIESVPLTQSMLKRIKFTDHRTLSKICLLVELHMIHTQSLKEKHVRTTLRQLVERGLDYDQLVEVCRCDVSGRYPRPSYTPDIKQDLAKKLMEEDCLMPIVTGELLLTLGIQPGEEMGKIIKTALKLQDRGVLTKDNYQSVLRGSGFKHIFLHT